MNPPGSPGGPGAPGPSLAERVTLAAFAARFTARLRAAGLPVTPEHAARFAAAIRLLEPQRVEDLYWAGRVTLVADREQGLAYDRVFDAVVRGYTEVAQQRGPDLPARRPPPERRRAGDPDAPGQLGLTPGAVAATAGEPGEREQPAGWASAQERLRTTDFAAASESELARLRAMLVELRLAPPLRSSRRLRRHPSGRDLDLRATLGRAHRTGGDPVERVWRRRDRRPRRLVLIADVSGSMEPYARAYLYLLHGAVRATRAEAFVFATRLTRLTRSLAIADPDVALSQVAAATPDYSGGTRIAAALATFTDTYGRRGLARGAVVVIVSDGWECGDADALGEQMARLRRLAYRVVWVNPRSASPGYAPLAAGMAAALPHVDAFLSGHSVDAMDTLVDVVRAQRRSRPPPAARSRAGSTPG